MNRFIEYRPMLSIARYSTAVVELRSGGRIRQNGCTKLTIFRYL